jgi:hypothetical protein
MKPIALLVGALALGALIACATAEPPPSATPAAPAAKLVFQGEKLVIPKGRDLWITLGVTYALSYEGDGGTTFNTVRADPASYEAFVKTGVFPVGTMLDLEVRKPLTEVAPAKGGKTEGPVIARSIHVKDEKAGPGAWTFYGYPTSGGELGTALPRSQACYSCHADHAATDTVFTQYYPTMMEARAAAAKAP